MDSNPQELADPKEKLVLVVDDDESILDLLEHMVKKEGFKVERAADGQEAVRKVSALSPSLIILDFMLPGMGGYEVVKELQSGDGRNIPILVITGRKVDPQTVDMIRQEPNVNDYIEKPIRPAKIMSQIHAVLKTRPPEIKRGADRGPLSSSW